MEYSAYSFVEKKIKKKTEKIREQEGIKSLKNLLSSLDVYTVKMKD